MDVAGIDDFEDLFENAPCGYVTLLPNGRIEHVNPTLLATGPAILRDEMIGKRFSDFLNLAGRIYYETHIAPLLRMQGFFNEFAIDMLTAAGEPLQMIANAIERRDAERQSPVHPPRADQGYRSATLRKPAFGSPRSRKTRNLASERETSELREQFIAVLGHDLRNPLASISAGARILGREATTDKEHQVIAMLETTVVRMAGLIDDVLDFARGRLGGGITLDRDANSRLSPFCIRSSMNCGCPRRAARSKPNMRSMSLLIATGGESGSSSPISSGTPSAMARLTSQFAYAQQRKPVYSNCQSLTPANRYLRLPWTSCSSRFSEATCVPAGKDWVSAFTLRRRSLRPMKARLPWFRLSKRPVSPS